MPYEVEFTRQAMKDLKLLKSAGLLPKALALLETIQADPFVFPPSYEALGGDLKGKFSRRINIQHRLVYAVDETRLVIDVLRMWSHYGE
jgi:Txe/YoeB family toxin of toxin-antitoxin system